MASNFKVQLYDNGWRQVSNVPVLSNLLCHTSPSTNSGELAFNPTPPLLYKIDSVIRFDVYSLLVAPATLPVTVQMNFVGVRRIPCGKGNTKRTR